MKTLELKSFKHFEKDFLSNLWLLQQVFQNHLFQDNFHKDQDKQMKQLNTPLSETAMLSHGNRSTKNYVEFLIPT
jgi:hypothetical protein